MPGPLTGYRILDLSTVISGPLATMLLADQGADVVKVESISAPDHARGAGHGENEFTATFLNNNRNKRGVALDLKTPSGVEVLKKLAATADVFIQNFRPGVVERLGIGEEVIREIRPDIIYVSISGFGEQGPMSHKPVYDPIIQAISGLTTIQAGSDEERHYMVVSLPPSVDPSSVASPPSPARAPLRPSPPWPPWTDTLAETTSAQAHMRISLPQLGAVTAVADPCSSTLKLTLTCSSAGIVASAPSQGSSRLRLTSLPSIGVIEPSTARIASAPSGVASVP